VNEPACLALAAAGVLVYVITGVAGLAGGAPFLDYSVLPLPVSPVKARYFGILFIETGVAIAVAATIVLLFCRLADTRP
jgi:hypothetical protein